MSDRFSASLRGSALQASPQYQKVLRQSNQRRHQSPTVNSFASSARHVDVHLVQSQLASPTPARPQTPPTSRTAAPVTSANLARSISRRKGSATPSFVAGAGSTSVSRSSSAALGGGIRAQLQTRQDIIASAGDEVRPAIAALERVLDDEIRDLRRVTEKLERRVSSILSLEEHRQLLVRVAGRGGDRGESFSLYSHGADSSNSSVHRDAVNEVLLRVGALQLASPATPHQPTGGSPQKLFLATGGTNASAGAQNQSSIQIEVSPHNHRSSSSNGFAPLIVDLDRIDARPMPPPEPTAPPTAAVSLPLRQQSTRREDEKGSASRSPDIQKTGSPKTSELSSSSSTTIQPEVCALVSARLSSTELRLVEHQRELLALQSEVISLQRQYPENSSLSRLRLLLRDELSLCKRRESRLDDIATKFEQTKSNALRVKE